MRKKTYDILYLSGLVVIIIIGTILTGGLSALLAIPFLLFMFLGIRILGDRFGRFFLTFAINETMAMAKIGNKVLSLSQKYEKQYNSLGSVIDFTSKLILINFIATLLIAKILGVGTSLKNVGATLQHFLIAVVLSMFITMLISPLGLSMYVIEGSKYRLLDIKKGILDYPGILLRRIFRGLFGFGNFIVLIWVLLDSMSVAGWDIGFGIQIFLMLVFLILGALTLSALVVSLALWKFSSDKVNNLISAFQTNLEKAVISADEALSIFKEMLGVKEIEKGGETEEIL